MVVMENEEITHPAPPLELQKPPEPRATPAGHDQRR